MFCHCLSHFVLSVLTALPTSTLTVTPDRPVFTGETVDLKCEIESDHSDWRYEWYKDTDNNVMLQTSERYTVNTDTLTIRVITSDQGQYWCKGHIDGRSVSTNFGSSVYLSVKGELNIIDLLNSFYMFDHRSRRETFTLMINMLVTHLLSLC